MAAEEDKGRPHYTCERADDLSGLYMGTTKKGSRELIQVAVRFHHKKIPQGRSDEGPGLYDPGANNSFISESRVKELTLPVENKPSSISNGDGSVQYSPGYVDLEVSLAHGLKFKTRLIVAPLADLSSYGNCDCERTSATLYRGFAETFLGHEIRV